MFYKPQSRPLLIYILGWGRSGSSILANVLGSLDGAASFGEVRYIWDRGVLENTICGCGREFHSCAFWPDVSFGGTRFADMDEAEAGRLVKSIGSGGRPGQVPALHSASKRRAYFERHADDLKAMTQMYERIFEQSGKRVIIDSSKSPFYALNLLNDQSSFDVMFLHLTRDPRAVLHSWRKTKKREEGGQATYFPKYSSLRSLLQWRFVNASCERFEELAPEAYKRLKYEDFVSDWRASLVATAPDVFDAGDAVEEDPKVVPQHSISGNPSRFDSGTVKLKLDNAWEGQLRSMDMFLTNRLVSGAARRYGYSV